MVARDVRVRGDRLSFTVPVLARGLAWSERGWLRLLGPKSGTPFGACPVRRWDVKTAFLLSTLSQTVVA